MVDRCRDDDFQRQWPSTTHRPHSPLTSLHQGQPCMPHSIRQSQALSAPSGARRTFSTRFSARDSSTIASAPPRQTGGAIAVRSTRHDSTRSLCWSKASVELGFLRQSARCRVKGPAIGLQPYSLHRHPCCPLVGPGVLTAHQARPELLPHCRVSTSCFYMRKPAEVPRAGLEPARALPPNGF